MRFTDSSSDTTTIFDSVRLWQLPQWKKPNPKRMQREVRRQVLSSGIGTKSQQALKLQQEQNKQERKARSREDKRIDAERLFELKQQKKREKHLGH